MTKPSCLNLNMVDNRIFLTEYTYTAISGRTYHPSIKNGEWYLLPGAHPTDFLIVVWKCNIPDDEAMLLKLKYGG